MYIYRWMYNTLSRWARRIKTMVAKNLMSIALVGIPLSFVTVIWAFNTDSSALKFFLWIGSGGLFISSILALRQANVKAEEYDSDRREQNKKLLDILGKINSKLK